MKKIFLTTFLVLLLFSSIPGSALAIANPCKPFGGNRGLVPPPGGDNGEYILTDFFRMIAGIINCVIFGIVPPIAILMLIIGGLVFLFARGSPELASLGKNILKTVFIGLFLVYGAWLIVDTILKTIGYSGDWWKLPG